MGSSRIKRVSPDDGISREVIEALNLKQANSAFIGADFHRLFPSEGKWYSGKVKRVESGLPDANGNIDKGFQFLIKYEDGDEEHVSLDDAIKGFKDRAAVRERLLEVQSKRQRVEPSREPLTNLGNGHPGSSQRVAVKAKRGAANNIDITTQAPTQQAAERGPTFGTQVINDSSASVEPIPYRDDGTRTIGLPGHLKCIELVDFMCHHHMQMDFNPHVTFVSGTNGSGKSATLQALQCCLGVQARKTGRSTSQKGFIRTGAHEAIIRVTIWNKPYFGKDAFQYETYGDTITVERRITVSSSSSWALKDHHGRIMARRREDLDSMISVLGINAANPVTVMTQDTARSFLTGSTNKADQEKWTLYMDCTQLGTIADNLLETQQQINEMEASVDKIKESYDTLITTRDTLKKQCNDLKCIEEWRFEQEEIEKMLTWACIEADEKVLAELEAKLAAAPEDAEDLEGYIATLERELASLTETVATKRSFLENFDKNSEEKAHEETAAKAEVKKAKREVLKLHKKIEELEKALHEEELTKDTLTQAAIEVEKSFNDEARATQADYLHEMEEADEKVRLARAATAEMSKKKDEAELASREAQVEFDIAQRAVQARESDFSDLQKQLADLKRNAKSKTSVHMFGGAGMVKMVQQVDLAISQGQFHRAPIGPVGRYLELTDPTWGRAVESALFYNMSSFLAHDQHDMQILNRILQNCNFPQFPGRPNICVMRLDLPKHNVPASAQPNPNVTTLLRVLKVNDVSVEAPVMNFLVDQGRVEGMALATNYEHGKTLVRERNVGTVYEADGSKRYKRGMTESHEPFPQFMRTQPVRIGSTTAGQQKELTINTANAKAQVDEARLNAEKAAKALEVTAVAAREARMALIDCRKVENEAKQQVELLRDQQPPELAATEEENVEGQDGVQHEIIQATQNIMDFGNKLEERRQQLGEAEAVLAEAQAAADAIGEEHERLKAENEEFVSTFEATVKQVDEKKAELAEKHTDRTQRAAERADLLEEIEHKKGNLANGLSIAEEMCDREEANILRGKYEDNYISKGQTVERFFTPSFLDKKYTRLNNKIANAEREAGGSLTEKEADLQAAQQRVETEGARQKAAVDLYGQLLEAYRYRKKKFTEVDEAVELNVNQRFRAYMKRKGHTGKLKIDRDNKQLSLSVQIGKDAVGNEKIKDLKQLSGGERSYTTVAFTLALGSTTEMPFRAMDEFDVFMDSINRRIAMENLLQFAKEQPDLQFVFLTPQDMAAVDEAKRGCAKAKCPIPDDFIKIVAMKPARQNATTA